MKEERIMTLIGVKIIITSLLLIVGYSNEVNITYDSETGISIKRFGKQRALGRRRRMVIDTSEPLVEIPMYIHVFYPMDIPVASANNPTVNIGDEQIFSLEGILSEDFQALNKWILSGGITDEFKDLVGNPKLHPYVDTIKRIPKPSGWKMDFGAVTDGNEIYDNEHLLKRDSDGGSSSEDPDTYLNVWIAQFTDDWEETTAYSYSTPIFGDCVSSAEKWREGVVIQPEYVGRKLENFDNSFYFGSNTLTEGKTITHEVGHYFGLRHTVGGIVSGFGAGTCDDECTDGTGGISLSDGDCIDDTPVVDVEGTATSESNCGGLVGKERCDTLTMWENFMDYYGDCRKMFTNDQANHMREMVLKCHLDMYNNGAIFPFEMSPWIFVVDISPSMDNDIDAVLNAVNLLIADLNANLRTPAFYVLSQFHNPSSVEGLETRFIAQAKAHGKSSDFVNELEALIDDLDDGIVCSESALSGIDEGISTAITYINSQNLETDLIENSNVFVFTDASQQDNDPLLLQENKSKYDTLLGIIANNAIRINYILSDSCIYDSQENENVIDAEFSLLAHNSGGFIFPTTEDNIYKAAQIIHDLLVYSDHTPKVLVETTASDSQFDEYFWVDPGYFTIIIIISGNFESKPKVTQFTRELSDGSIKDVEDDISVIYSCDSDCDGYLQVTVFIDGLTDSEEWRIQGTYDNTNRRRLQNSALEERKYIHQLRVYAGDAAIQIDIKVSNIDDSYGLVSTSNGYIFYNGDEDESFVIWVSSANDGTVFINEIMIRSYDYNQVISNSQVYHDSINDVYYSIFTFNQLISSGIGLNEFKVEAIGTDIDGNTFNQVKSLVTKITNVNIDVDCSNALFIINHETNCQVVIERSDQLTVNEEIYDVSASIDNLDLADNGDIILSLPQNINGTVEVVFPAGVATISMILTIVVADNSNIVGQTFWINSVISDSDVGNLNLTNYDRQGIFTILDDWCPTACTSDPCSCDEISNCINCHASGCAQCETGYFKKDYNYPCVECHATFGDDCLFCQDFHGCGQCDESTSTRKYDSRCDLYYCEKMGTVSSDPVIIDASLIEHDCKLGEYKCSDDRDCYCSQVTNCKVCNDDQGCSECEENYFKKDYNYNCAHCQEIFGDECLFCQDFNGCAQCQTNCQRVMDPDCGIWYCQC